MTKLLEIDLGARAIDALAEIRLTTGAWRAAMDALTAFFDGTASFLDGTASFLDGTASPTSTAVVEQALQRCGLLDDLERLEVFWRSLADRNKALLRRLDDVAGVQSWPVLGVDREIGSLGLGVGNVRIRGAASLTGELEHMGAEALSSKGITLAPEDAVLRIGLDGSLEADASIAGRYGFVAAKAAASAAGSAELDYYLSGPGERLLLEAVHEALPHLASPGDPQQLLAERSHGLEAVQLRVNGTTELAAQVGAGLLWGETFSVDAPGSDTAQPLGVAADLKVGFSASLKLRGAFELLVRPTADDVLLVSLVRVAGRTSATTFDVSAGIGVTGLDELATGLLPRLMPDAGPLIAELQPYLDLGSYLRAQLNQHGLDLGPLQEPLIEMILGQGAEADLRNAITTAIETAARARLDGYSADAAETARGLAGDAAERLGLSGALQEQLIARLAPPLTTAISEAKKQLLNRIDSWLDASPDGTSLESFLTPLEVVGARVDELIQATRNDILEPVLRFLDRYQSTRAKITAAIEGAARLKIGLACSRSLQTDRATDLLLRLQIDPRLPGVAEAYRRMLVGSFDQVLALARTPGAGVILREGLLADRLERKLTTSFALKIGTLTLSSKLMMTSTVTATHDLATDVVIATSHSDLHRIVTGYKEERSIRFISSFELAGGAGASPDSSLLTAALSVSLKDERLHPHELEEFLGSLEQWALIAQGSTRRALQRLEELTARADGKLQKAHIGVCLPLDAARLSRMLQLSNDDIETEAIRIQVPFFFPAKQTKRLHQIVGGWTAAHVRPGATLIDGIRAMASSDPFAVAEIIPGRQLTGTGERRTFLLTSRSIGLRARHFVELVEALREMQSVTIDTTIDTTTGATAEAREQLDRLNRKINTSLRSWLKVENLVRGFFSERVRRPSAALIALMARLLQVDPTTPPLIPVIQWSFGEANQKDELVL